MADLIQLRRDTAANWTSANPTLSQGEQGYETDTGKMKIGDGSTAWTSLAYFVDSSAYATSSDITSAVSTKANTADLATVATSGSYNDLSDQPTIPADVSDLTDTTSLLGSGGGGGGSFEAVASGALANGDIVVVNSDGTVSVVTGSTTLTHSAGSEVTVTTFNQNVDSDHDAVFNPTANTVIIGYRDLSNSSYPTLQIGTISGSSISFGSKIVVHSVSSQYVKLALDTSANRLAVFFRNNSDAGKGIYKVGIPNTTGTTVTFISTAYEFKGAAVNNLAAGIDSNSNKVVLFYRTSTAYGSALVGTISGYSITFGSEITLASQLFFVPASVAFDSNSNKIVAVYHSYNSTSGTGYQKAIVGTVVSNSISFGSEVAFNTVADQGGLDSNLPSVVFDSFSNKIVIAYHDRGDSNITKAIVGEVSGDSISFGSPVTIFTPVGEFSTFYTNVGAAFDTSTNSVVISYSTTDGGNGVYTVSGQVSGDSISFGDAVLVSTNNNPEFIPMAFDSNVNKTLMLHKNYSTKELFATVITTTLASTTNLTEENYIGISDGVYSDGANATVQIVGSVDDAQSGLTPGQKYYVQGDGTLSTTADDPSVFAGTAVSATKLIVKG